MQVRDKVGGVGLQPVDLRGGVGEGTHRPAHGEQCEQAEEEGDEAEEVEQQCTQRREEHVRGPPVIGGVRG